MLHHGGLFDESRDRSAARPKDVESKTPVLISPYCRTESTGHRTIARLENPYDLANGLADRWARFPAMV
ncbi:hypothetical protein [Leptolyngbya sp. FACHB-711]|uniref:hypothetical protein n=1 Tax=Leptolyngbya sp. FACHB-711 TaxID=2692813 RepID=UPI001686F928|nr:hypothetical protein [Leptolyngbya sp. FACHB-711]MBD2023291.1 hypothetical protein [Leptolyngbya sp. FACHB-711]